jgi:hypothetical protein
MLKILTYINTAFLVVVMGGGAFAYFQRGKISDALLEKVKGQIPSLVTDAMPKPPAMPKVTGPVIKPLR